jgi:hypothetical protein
MKMHSKTPRKMPSSNQRVQEPSKDEEYIPTNKEENQTQCLAPRHSLEDVQLPPSKRPRLQANSQRFSRIIQEESKSELEQLKNTVMILTEEKRELAEENKRLQDLVVKQAEIITKSLVERSNG